MKLSGIFVPLISRTCLVPGLRLSLLGLLALAFVPNKGLCAGPSFIHPTTAFSINQDANAATLNYLMLVSDTDAGKTLTWSQATAPAHGTLTFTSATAGSGSTSITPGGTITYTPTALYNGPDSFAVKVSDGTLTATQTITVTVDCLPIGSNLSDVSAHPGQIGSYWTETRGSSFGLDYNGEELNGIPQRGYFQFRVGSGAWQTLGAFGGGSTAPSGATLRYVDTNSTSTINQMIFVEWSSSAGNTTTSMFINPAVAPTNITADLSVIWDNSTAGALVANLTPEPVSYNGSYVLNSQSNPNLLAVSGSTLVVGTGAMPADGQVVTATVTYYDPFQIDCDGHPITNNPTLGAPAVQTLSFLIRNSTPAPKAKYVVGQPNFTNNSPNTTVNSLNVPTDVAIDSSHGKVYVADDSNSRILRYAWPVTGNQPNAEVVFGQPNFVSANTGCNQTNLTYPTGMSVDSSGNLWVADYGNSRVLKFSAAYAVTTNMEAASVVLGQSSFTASTANTSVNGLSSPNSVTVDAAGNLWVADTGNNRVLRFASATSLATGASASGVLGQSLFTTGTSATSQSGFNSPQGLTSSGTTLFVSDTYNNRVLRFAGAASKSNGGNADSVLGQTNYSTSDYQTTQNGLSNPYGLCVDANGSLYVADMYNYRVLIYSNAVSKANGGNADSVIGTTFFDDTNLPGPTTQSLLYYPTGLGFDASAGMLVVVDENNNRALVYAPLTGTTCTVSGTPNPSAYGQSVTFTATVTRSSGSATPSGTVTFSESGTNLGTGTLSGSGASATTTYSTSTLSAGTHTITASYSGDSNFNPSSGSTSPVQTVNKATPSVTTWPTASTITYGQTLASSTLSGGSATPTGSFAWTTSSTAPGAGTAPQNVTFTPSDTADYTTVTGTTSLTVNKATSTVTTWPTASTITYGQTLASSTLTGGSSTPTGGFAWTTSSTTPNAGTASQSVTFTPSDATDFTTVIGTTSLTVNKATPTVTTWPTASTITYGQTLASSILTGGSSTPTGGFAWTTPGTAPNAGTATQSVTFTPSDLTDYTTLAGTVSVTVNPASQTINFAALPPFVIGDAPYTLSATASSGLPVTFASSSNAVASVSGDVLTIAGIGTATITAAQAGGSNYLAATNVSELAIVSPPIMDLSISHDPIGFYSVTNVGHRRGSSILLTNVLHIYTNVILTITGNQGHAYQVQSENDLSQSNWQTLFGTTNLPSPNYQIIDSATNQARFYRLMRPNPNP